MMRRSLTVVARVAGWLIVPLYVAGNCAFFLLRRGAGLGNGANLLDDVEGAVLNVGFGAFAVVGALLVAKRSTNLIGWIMAAIALMVSIFNAGVAPTPPTSCSPEVSPTRSRSWVRGPRTATGS
jgi:hypothetical protein